MPVLVVYVGFLSMYPTVNALMGLWALLTAERIELEDATTEIQALLTNVTIDQCFDHASWQLPVLVQLAPEGDVLTGRNTSRARVRFRLTALAAKYLGRQGIERCTAHDRLETELLLTRVPGAWEETSCTSTHGDGVPLHSVPLQ